MENINGVTNFITFTIGALKGAQLARTFKDDFARHQIKLEILQLRLSRLGEVIEIAVADKTQQSLASSVESIFLKIKDHLQKGREDSERLGGIRRMEDNQDIEPLDPESLTGEFRKIRNQLRRICGTRRAQMTIESTKWMLYKKEEFDRFITNITDLMGRLETLPGLESGNLRRLCDQECNQFPDSELKVLDDAIDGCDPLLKEAISDKLISADRTRSITQSYNTNSHVTGIHYGKNQGFVYGSRQTNTFN